MRADLLALSPDKLAALANRGLVKRAQKMLAKGQVPRLEREGETVVAHFEEATGSVRTELPMGVPLIDCPCTCGATKVCRHRIGAVLAYQAEAESETESVASPAIVDWSPGAFDDDALVARLGKRTMARATRRLNQGYVARLRRPTPGDDAPTAALETCSVRFLVPNDLAHVRCDCSIGLDCEHVALAVWAFREGDADARPQQIVEVSGKDQAHAADLFEPAMHVTRQVLLDGVEGASPSLRTAFARAREAFVREKMIWPADLVEELEELLALYHGWSESYGIEAVAQRLTELHARVRAARSEGRTPRRVVLGMGQAPETALGQVRLLGLGARVDVIKDRLKARLFFAEPKGNIVLVWEREWDREGSTDDPHGGKVTNTERDGAWVAERRQLDVSLRALAAAQVVTQKLHRRANGRIRFGRSRTSRPSVAPQSGRWAELLAPPLLVADLREELERRRSAPPRHLRPRLLADSVRAVAIGEVLDVAFRPSRGVLSIHALDLAGNELTIEVPKRPETPHAIDAAARAAESEIRFVSGSLERERRGWVVEPLALVGAGLTVPDLARPERAPLPPPVSEVGGEDPLAMALRTARDRLDAMVQPGLRRELRSRERLAELTGELKRVGLVKAAGSTRALEVALERLAAGVSEEAPAAWLDASLRIDLSLEALSEGGP